MLLASVLLAPVALRASLLVETEIPFGLPDLRGFLSDLVVSLFLATVIAALARWTRWAGLALLLLWNLLTNGNYEHVKALGALAGLAHAKYLVDPTFLKGSALAISRPLLLMGILGGSGLLAWFATSTRRTRFRLVPLLLAAVATWVVHLSLPLEPEALTWRQANYVYENIRWLVIPVRAQESPLGVTPTQRREIDRLRRGDLNGEPIIELGNHGQNVMLILLEGISGAHLDSIAQVRGVNPLVKMPRLDRFAERHVLFRSFVSHQRQTNRGEYAILCGDYPKLITGAPKMSEYVVTGGAECLPSVLNDAGYETVYLQAAPLGFMLKDQFMPQIGFSRVHGDEWFVRPYSRTEWGIDDRAYFEQSLKMVDELQRGPRPWFLNLLTVGTHHPYNAPEYFESVYPKDSLGWAVEYLDEAVEFFVEELERSGVLENTLVLITSDESLGIKRGADDLTKILSQNWSFLIAMLPSKMRMKIDVDYMHVDLALSVLDYLGHTAEASRFAGRSVFRHYDTNRPIVFANTFMRMVGALDASEHLYLCPENFLDCSKYEVEDGRLFSPQRRRTQASASEVEFLRRIAVESSRSSPRAHERGEFRLLADPMVRILDTPEQQLVMAGQSLSVAAGTRIEVDLVVQVLGGEEGLVKLRHDFVRRHAERYYSKEIPDLGPGSKVTVRYSYTTPEALDRLEFRFWVTKLRGDGLSLNFETARLRFYPQRGASGLEVGEFEVSRAE